MRIITLNVNGIRSAERKGLSRWLARAEPWDVVCLQEIKAHLDQIPKALRAPRRAHGFFLTADRKGYAGVALYAKQQPEIATGFGCAEFDGEGRYLEARFAKLAVASVYLPSGSAGPHRQASKYRFLETFLPHLRQLRKAKREIILCGDWNIAHQPIDLKNWRSNQKHSGFLPDERAWLTRVFEELGFVDVFRALNKEPEQYTWWSNRGQAWAKNVGWRIDYQIATPGIAAKAKAVSIYKNRRFSDHAPLIVDYNYTLRDFSAPSR
jgi:exodeoxyribonuclease-3